MYTFIFIEMQKTFSDQSSGFLRTSCRNSTSLLLVISLYNFASSANKYNFDLTVFGIEFIHITNKTGRSTDPWGNPLTSSFHLDLLSFITTLRRLVNKNSLIQPSVFPFFPYCSRIPISLFCGTELNAFLKVK